MADELVGVYTIKVYRTSIEVDIKVDNGLNVRMLERAQHLLNKELVRRRVAHRMSKRESIEPRRPTEAEEIETIMEERGHG